ncbi:S-layer family protein [Lentilactobacillus diolivorans DSM 14421]|uniref:S-layer family protein n=2 Tax=Lentilactobacillus diolivorans TaxID=179838 RepID=A0A0R1SF72_9LACO|nr:S-layer family protein [Lentilactobacillus diolivorans DSM 14421]
MAALGFVAVAGTYTATNASAKTYAKVTSNRKMSTDPTTRNITFNGSNALYTKAGTLRGARIVARKGTLSALANSKSSSDNFRVYRIATTNRKSVYYKIVSFDRQYRGWIYGGKTQGAFNGGIQQFATFQSSNLTDAQKNSTYKFANTGVANDGKTVTYVQPAWTQYKVGRAIIDSSPYANATFKIDQVGTRTREGDQWVHIIATDNSNSQANGWILFSGLTQAQTPIADYAIRINLVDPSNNNAVVKSFDWQKSGATKGTPLGNQNNNNWSINSNDQRSIQSSIRNALNGTGFNLDTLTSSQLTALAQTKFGDSINLNVNKATNIADNAVRINIMDGNGNVVKSLDWNRNGATKGNNVGSQINGNWTLNNNDQQSIQNQINNTLSNSGYYLNLSNDQAAQIAQATFGGSVYLYANSNVIASQALRINLYSQSGRYIGYTDFTRSGATNGTNVGNYSNGTWNISDADANTILNQINNVLSANGYQTVGNTLTAAQRAQIAQGVFGGSISLTGYNSQTQNNYSTIVPNTSYTTNGNTLYKAMQQTTDSYANGPIIFPNVQDPTQNFNVSAQAVYENTNNARTNLVASLKASKDGTSLISNAQLAVMNSKILNSVKDNYYYKKPNTSLSFTTGPQGTPFSGSQLTNYITATGSDLATLNSPVYPVITRDPDATKITIEWHHFKYDYDQTNPQNGTNGYPVNAYWTNTDVKGETNTY